MIDKLFVATKAFVMNKGRILIVKESSKYKEGANAGKFDVAGGRVKPGERFDDGLRREIKEETGLDVTIGKPFFVTEWRPVVKGEKWQIVATFFECTANTDEVTLSEDHEEYKWIRPEEYLDYPHIETNLPAFEAFLKK
jgi:8-oxo-dGTP pyrophosphatase MutT (NUDIX family)